MDQRERIGDREEVMRAAIRDALANTWVCLPAIVQYFDPVKCTCTAQVAIKIRVNNGTKWTWQQIPALIRVPVHFPGGGNFLVTFPLAVGDEVLIMFADRCIDAWWQSGGVQQQVEYRIHDLSDGFAIPKVFSVPKVPANISTTTAQLRSMDGTAYIELAPSGVINLHAPGGFNVVGAQANTGALTATGEITAKQGTSNNTVSAHVHGGVTAGTANTSTPTG